MTVYVFTGPTLPAEAVRAEIDAICLPPAAGGDVYRAARNAPVAIALIDGYFERKPSVWHKEILWAMAQGVHVFGAASMGALRAADLSLFGMEGVGSIFEAYRDGTLEDDDEVAVAHAGAEDGYRPLSEPMVNIRATLAAAEAATIVAPLTRALLERTAKELFYPERSYPVILQRSATNGAPVTELERLRAWLPEGSVDQKRSDAVAMLRLIQARLLRGLPPKEVRYTLEQTEYWDRIQREEIVTPANGKADAVGGRVPRA
jgi:hypothetical protein